MANVEEAIKDAALDLLLHIKQETESDIREVADFSNQIQEAFTYALVSGNENAIEELQARTSALLELTRIKAIQEKKEAIISAVLVAAKVTKTLISALA